MMSAAPYDIFQQKLPEYNHTAELTQDEVAALAHFLDENGHTRPHRLKTYGESLERLLQPLTDALDILGTDKSQIRNNVLEAFLREIANRQQSYWVWANMDWDNWLQRLETMNISNYAREVRYYIVSTAYLIGGYDRFWRVKYFKVRFLSERLFGSQAVLDVFAHVTASLIRIGYGSRFNAKHIRTTLSLLILLHRSADLQTLHVETLPALYRETDLPAYMRPAVERISHALFGMGILSRPISSERMVPRVSLALTGVSAEWADWCQRWRETSAYVPSSRYRHYYTLLQIGRWLAEKHPEITSPEQWTRDLAAEFIATVDQMHTGQYALHRQRYDTNILLSANAKKNTIATIKVFFRDLHEWEWIKPRFDPHRSFRVANHIIAAAKTPPRVLSEDVWAKLIWAGLNLTEDDIDPYNLTRDSLTPVHKYPIEMLQALVTIWLFAGLRSDEIGRLRVGCIRWQEAIEADSKHDVCLLEVPAHKTGPAFTKPVDGLVGRAIERWEHLRPELPSMPDHKTGERVHYLFVYRARRMGKQYINQVLIPILCKKAGIPLEEARGKITSHRARSTIATQLFNAKDPMSLFELQAWLGHSSPHATQRYVQLTPTHLAQAYTDAEYFKRNLRRIEVLIDQDVILNGTAATGEPWKFYDLGHGYCTYDFFDQCPHRMACAKCDFYRPKGSSQAQLLEAKSNLQRMLQEIPLTDEECTAVEDGLDAIARLMEKLVDVPTPSGQTPRQLNAEMGFVPLTEITVRPQS